jgi:hypothetical protein
MAQAVAVSDGKVATNMPVRNDLLTFPGGFEADG